MRYCRADQDCLDLLKQVIKDFFPQLKNAAFLVLMDDKSTVKQGKAVFARISKASEQIRTLTDDIHADGADYILYLDYQVWNSIGNSDRIRLLRHELQHCFYDPEAKSNPYKTIGHEVEDFVQELERNSDDPLWWDRLTQAWKKAYPKAKGEGPTALDANQLELFGGNTADDAEAKEGRSSKVVPLKQASGAKS